MDKCVLIVDDNDFNRELVKDILEDEDITVYEAEDGSSAIELLESEQADDIYVGRTYNKTGRVVNTLPVLRVYYLDSPIKKSATVPGPECVPIVGHI